MPLVRISLLKIWSANQKRKISDAIHEALVEAFKIPDSDYNHQIVEFEKGNLLFSKYKSEKYILVEMTVFPGRSKQAKCALYEKTTGNLGKLGIEAEDVVVVLNEPPLENWGLSGKSGEQAKIGFNLNV